MTVQSLAFSRLETQDIKTQPQFNHHLFIFPLILNDFDWKDTGDPVLAR